MPNKVLVLGARGFLGEHVVDQLCAAGHQVHAVVRQGTLATACSPQVQVLCGDCGDVDFLRSALERVDAAIFCAGRTWQPGLQIAEYRRQNVAITQTFFAALGHSPEKRVVFTSSLSTVGGSKTPRVYTEQAGRQGILEQRLSPYDRAKIDCEQIALQSARSGNDVILLNPGLLLGPGARATSNLAAPFCLLWFLQGQFAARFTINGGVTLSDVRDVAAAHVAALQHGTAGQRYILGGHNLDRRAFYSHVTTLTGRRMPTALPGRFLYGLMSAADALAYLSGGLLTSPVHRSFAYTQGLYYFGASDRAIAELDYAPMPIEQTILDMMHYYQSRGLLPESLSIPSELTLPQVPALVLLRQLVKRSGYGRPLGNRLPDLYRACQANDELRSRLSHLLAISTFDAHRGGFRWQRAEARGDLETLQKFIEYVYFSSHAFLRKVL